MAEARGPLDAWLYFFVIALIKGQNIGPFIRAPPLADRYHLRDVSTLVISLHFVLSGSTKVFFYLNPLCMMNFMISKQIISN